MSLVVPASGVFDIETYGGLVEWIGDELDRGDLVSEIANFIRLCEYSIDRRLLHIHRQDTVVFNVTGEKYPLPDDYRQAVSLHLKTDPVQQLQLTSLSGLREGFKGTGQPAAYAIDNGQICFGPAPDGTYSASLTYLKAFPKLSDQNPTNWILQSHADIYVYGALVQAEAFLNNDERIGLWKLAFEEAVNELNQAGVRYRKSASPLRLASPVCV